MSYYITSKIERKNKNGIISFSLVNEKASWNDSDIMEEMGTFGVLYNFDLYENPLLKSFDENNNIIFFIGCIIKNEFVFDTNCGCYINANFVFSLFAPTIQEKANKQQVLEIKNFSNKQIIISKEKQLSWNDSLVQKELDKNNIHYNTNILFPILEQKIDENLFYVVGKVVSNNDLLFELKRENLLSRKQFLDMLQEMFVWGLRRTSISSCEDEKINKNYPTNVSKSKLENPIVVSSLDRILDDIFNQMNVHCFII